MKSRKGFVEGPADKFGNKKIVNLDQVSNVCFENYVDRFNQEKWKIIFNFAFPISLSTNNTKIIPEYCYFIYDNKNDYDKVIDKLNVQINEQKWIAPLDETIDRIVNTDYISFISSDPRKNRIIVNLACSVSFYNDYSRMTSDFVFFDFQSPDKYKAELVYMKDVLGV